MLRKYSETRKQDAKSQRLEEFRHDWTGHQCPTSKLKFRITLKLSFYMYIYLKYLFLGEFECHFGEEKRISLSHIIIQRHLVLAQSFYLKKSPGATGTQKTIYLRYSSLYLRRVWEI